MEKAISMLSEIKESIINAYELKTGMSRAKIARLMDAETWMDANKAMELGFADEMLQRDGDINTEAMLYSENTVSMKLWNKLKGKYQEKKQGRSVESLMRRLTLEEKFM